MKDEQGNIRVEATTSWIVLNLETRRFVRDPKLINEGSTCSDNAIEQPADKIQLPKDVEPTYVMNHVVSYSDVDMLGHTNNAMYMHWAMDAVDYEITSTKPLKEFIINFNRETRAGDSVEIYKTVQETEDGLRIFVEGKVEGASSFCIEMRF
jgi:acyl-ACP thioesterase